MGTIIINGRRYLGNNVEIRDGKVVIDGKSQDGDLHGGLDTHVVEAASGAGECVVRCGESGGDIAADASVNVSGWIQAKCSVTARGRAGGSIQALASASPKKR